jgi:hypothetical protein
LHWSIDSSLIVIDALSKSMAGIRTSIIPSEAKSGHCQSLSDMILGPIGDFSPPRLAFDAITLQIRVIVSSQPASLSRNSRCGIIGA